MAGTHRTFFHLPCMFSGLVSPIVLVYMLSVFSFNYKTDGWTRAVDPITILGSTAVTARGNALFWLNNIWGLQIRKTSYPINLSLKASPSV